MLVNVIRQPLSLLTYQIKENTLKNYKNNLNNDTFRTTQTTDWTNTIMELLPYIVAIVGITTVIIMLGVVEEILRNN